MIKVESLKDYIQILNQEEFLELATRIYMITDFICEDYPKHKEWYFFKQLPAILGDERNILFVRGIENPNDIIAMSCLKRDGEEQKICTLYVSDKVRGVGLGTTIVEESMKWLGTTKPLITLADYKLEMFTPIIKKYGWKHTETVEGLYNDRAKELCFNGTLTNKHNDEKRDLQNRLVKILRAKLDKDTTNSK